tara:strand:- start:2098 stop:2790 length:693 start_codon:yes stop_codon:yes gene_type:complete
MNKSVITNLVAILIILIGFSVKDNYSFILMTGIFAFSGSITNWLAVHMLFEKIPFLYGSGVILDRFQDIKVGIKNLILEELFSAEQINKFLLENKDDLSEKFIDKIDFDRIFQGLVEAIEGSQLGGMLAMVGGRKALDPLKDPIIVKLKIIIGEIISENSGDNTDEQSSKSLIIKIETVLDARLADLTPKDIKRIIQKMIRDHLGWLVVWGGFFGGLLGLLLSPIAFNLL